MEQTKGRPFMRAEITLDDAKSLPRWRRPEAMLVVMAFGTMMVFSTWMAVAANFVIEVVGFDGADQEVGCHGHPS